MTTTVVACTRKRICMNFYDLTIKNHHSSRSFGRRINSPGKGQTNCAAPGDCGQRALLNFPIRCIEQIFLDFVYVDLPMVPNCNDSSKCLAKKRADRRGFKEKCFLELACAKV